MTYPFINLRLPSPLFSESGLTFFSKENPFFLDIRSISFSLGELERENVELERSLLHITHYTHSPMVPRRCTQRSERDNNICKGVPSSLGGTSALVVSEKNVQTFFSK